MRDINTELVAQLAHLQDPGKARRLLRESKSWPRLVERSPPWRRSEWWERQRLRASLPVLVPVLLFAIRFLLRVWIHTT
jgi:hypothetical protein